MSRGRLELDRPVDVWVGQAHAHPRAVVVEFTPEIGVIAGGLCVRGFHGDPADRLIVATAMLHGISLVTKDKKIRAFELVSTVW